MACLRICATYDDLPPEDCTIPERCEQVTCVRCRRPMHYDPKARIPLLGEEIIVCEKCSRPLLAKGLN